MWRLAKHLHFHAVVSTDAYTFFCVSNPVQKKKQVNLVCITPVNWHIDTEFWHQWGFSIHAREAFRARTNTSDVAQLSLCINNEDSLKNRETHLLCLHTPFSWLHLLHFPLFSFTLPSWLCFVYSSSHYPICPTCIQPPNLCTISIHNYTSPLPSREWL